MAGSAASVCAECQLLKIAAFGDGKLSMTHDLCHLEMILSNWQPCAFCKSPGFSPGFASQFTPQSHMQSPAVQHALCPHWNICTLSDISLCINSCQFHRYGKRETLLLFSRSSYSWL